MKKLLTTVLSASLLFIAGTSYAGEVKVGSGPSVAQNIIRPIMEDFKSKTGITLRNPEVGPKLAMEELLKGNLDIACVGVTFDEWADVLKRESGITIKKEDFKLYEIGRNAAWIFVHESNPVTSLTKQQIKDIYMGKITNWKEVGGKDMPIVVVWARFMIGPNSAFIEKMLDKEKPKVEMIEQITAQEVLEMVKNTPEAIALAPEAFLKEKGVKSIPNTEVVRSAICATKGAPNQNAKILLDYLKAKPLN